jgi:BirA family biotin operon repressor/biotin-[acetyl-CoA-carboxylase] ligase
MLDDWEALASWRGRTLGDVEVLPEVDSTNAEALRRVDAGAPADALVLVARRQTAGHGSRGRAWHDSEGRSVALTALLRWPEDVPRALATWAGALAVFDLFRDGGVAVRIKWPNDVLIRERKVAGVLAETRTSQRSTWIALGIGLNVGQRSADFPDEIARSATSLALEGCRVALADATFELMLQLDARLTQLFERSPALVRDGFAQGLGLLGTRVSARTPVRTFRGVLAGLDLDGSVLIRTGEGTSESEGPREPGTTRIPGGHVLSLDEA